MRRKVQKNRRKVRKKIPKLLKIGEYCVNITVEGCVDNPSSMVMDVLNKKRLDEPKRVGKGYNMAESCERIKPSIKKVKATTANDSILLFNNLKGKSAEQIIKRYDLDSTIPVNLNKVFKENDIKVVPVDFRTFEDIPEISKTVYEKGAVLGAVAIKDNKINILYKEDDSPHRQYFTIAHELAHCCLDAEELAINGRVDFRLDIEQPSKEEMEANIFAGALLVPKSALDILYKQIKEPKLSILAKIFDVSINVMKARLDYLKLSYEYDLI